MTTDSTAVSQTAPATARPVSSRARVLILGGALVAALLINTGIAVAARGLGASPDFRQLSPAAYVTLTVIGFLLGVTGWALIRARTRNPASVLRWVVPTVLLLSFVPDLGILLSGAFPGTSPGAVAALALMHLAVAAVTIPALAKALPVRESDRQGR